MLKTKTPAIGFLQNPHDIDFVGLNTNVIDGRNKVLTLSTTGGPFNKANGSKA
jgi:hypothetical protein